MNKKINEALNEQLNREYFASYLYFAMASFFEEQGYGGFAKWMEAQSKEEHDHMMRIYRYILDRSGTIDLQDIKAPKFKGKDTLHVIETALKHEKKVSDFINSLMDLAVKEHDYATQNFLQWFIAEQVEEEALFSKIEQKLGLVGDNKAGLYMLDREIGDSYQDLSAE